VLLTDDSFATLRRWRLEATIEAEAPGEPFDTKREDHRALLPEIARQLAALHRSSDVRWGKPWRPENEMAEPRRFWAGRILKFRERINTTTSQLTAEELKRGLEQLKRRLDEIQLSWPSLVHGDVTGSHIFVGEGGALSWIDFGASAYWLPEEDLAQVRTRLFSGQDFARFLGIYSKHARGDRAIEPETIKTLAIFQLWERLNSRVQRRLRREVKQQQTGETKASLHLLAEEQRRIEHQLAQIIMGER
jgi:aminoglycoside phosphotransferase (APT) family kinase protein